MYFTKKNDDEMRFYRDYNRENAFLQIGDESY